MASLAPSHTPSTSLPRDKSRRAVSSCKSRLIIYGFIALIVTAIFLRLLVVVLAGNRINAPWGGIGDAPAYVLLAHNIADGRGYGYAGHPTAYRAPGYVLMLTGLIKAAPNHALAIMR